MRNSPTWFCIGVPVNRIARSTPAMSVAVRRERCASGFLTYCASSTTTHAIVGPFSQAPDSIQDVS